MAVPQSAAENRQEILETNDRALSPDEPCSRSMHVKMHKRKQPVGCTTEVGPPLHLSPYPFGQLANTLWLRIPCWAEPRPITTLHPR